jgi:hypothetical protein
MIYKYGMLLEKTFLDGTKGSHYYRVIDIDKNWGILVCQAWVEDKGNLWEDRRNWNEIPFHHISGFCGLAPVA